MNIVRKIVCIEVRLMDDTQVHPALLQGYGRISMPVTN